ncbi:hypothetical protein LTR78_007203 [Recurvomyces mirabilis]|uniref:[histone H3]-trimethyl-L-lysine(9) demethylase n=1 Tax=Recurvomyces mirabilis TaxID=574656 RepID=A0AAE0WJH0_9PEZI|nr:hypothetical protein LTR78_007203 [Recurvomyces mirabilis]KAK5155554.1 hypothetical protein LTS14_005815 [Recurvomyces mirabilis]
MEVAGNTPPAAMRQQHEALSPASHDGVKATTERPSTDSKPTNALTPPTSEEMNLHDHRQENEDSELSDLDLDDDDEEDIEPDHYWDGGKIPVFKPTMDQFRDFKKFCDKIDKYGMKSGIVKVIPPPGWRDSLPQLDEYVKRIKIKNPITQEFNGAYGEYTQQNVEKQRSYNLPEWKALTEETQYQHPAKRGERRRNQAQVVRGGGSLRGRAAAAAAAGVEAGDDSPKPKKKPGRPRRNPLPINDTESGDETSGSGRKTRGKVPPTPDSPATKPARVKPGPKAKPGPKGKGAQARSVTSRRLNNTAEAADHIDEAAFKNFDYHLDGLDEYTAERCAELEQHYWKSLAFNQPMYAADMPGSLFDESVTSWNVAQLPNLLDVLGTKVPGVNTAYLYMGMWKATFAWHLEDVDLYSINYIHFGAPKHWYSISQEDARKFEGAMKQVWPQDAKNCDQFLRHKTYLISPDVLQKQYGVKVNKLVHYEGEFVITYPYGYHSGFNLGYNCAESVNFATESWLDYGRIARKCNCEADNVWVDVSEVERKLRGEPTPEYYEETDDDDDLSDEEDGNLPSPPASVKGKASRGKKRKRNIKDEKPKKKKKIRIRIRAPTREPCVMCPNDNPWEPLLTTDTAKKAHRACALYTPETWIDKDDSGNEKICGVSTIDRARLELKCNFCRSKRGACFQCSSKKCTRAFHASCAAAAGVLVDAGLVPTFGEDGTEYFEEGFDFRCKYHRPKMDKHMNVEKIEADSKRIFAYAKKIQFNDVVQVQYLGAEIFAGLVVENRPGEQTVIVDVLPEGERVEVEWKWLCLLDPDDSLRPKPSATAQPMPEGMNKKALSVNNRQDGVPNRDDPFSDNLKYKWHDFYNMHTPPPGYTSKALQTPGKLKVDVNHPDSYYFYMPVISTEAKCFFTDKAGCQEIVAKANFLDRVASRPVQQYNAPRPQQITAAPAKQPIMRALPQLPRLAQYPPTTIGNPANRIEKPYTYKPKEASRPNLMWGVDRDALQTQRDFLASAQQRSTEQFNLPQPKPQYNYQGSDPARNQPLRPFSRDYYYSSEILPAAFPGEYSGFSSVVRRQSVSSPSPSAQDQSPAYVPNYQSVSQQMKQIHAPTVPAMAGASTNPYASGSSRPTSSAHSHQSPLGAPLTPATTASLPTNGIKTPPGYLENLQKYGYLKNSFLRRSAYVSPYAPDSGFSEVYQPLKLDEQSVERKHASTHTPNTSMSDVYGRPTSQQWTPPSQAWQSSGFGGPKQASPPPIQQYHGPHPTLQPAHPARQVVQPTYQTPLEFRNSFQVHPSTASRDGAQARLMRDQGYGYGSYAPHYAPAPHRNSFGQQSAPAPTYDTAKMSWDSPKAPIPSPLSDPNTPGNQNWNTLPRAYGTPTANMTSGLPSTLMRRQGSNGGNGSGSLGYGPMLPQMHGNETFRYN